MTTVTDNGLETETIRHFTIYSDKNLVDINLTVSF